MTLYTWRFYSSSYLIHTHCFKWKWLCIKHQLPNLLDLLITYNWLDCGIRVMNKQLIYCFQRHFILGRWLYLIKNASIIINSIKLLHFILRLYLLLLSGLGLQFLTSFLFLYNWLYLIILEFTSASWGSPNLLLIFLANFEIFLLFNHLSHSLWLIIILLIILVSVYCRTTILLYF